MGPIARRQGGCPPHPVRGLRPLERTGSWYADGEALRLRHACTTRHRQEASDAKRTAAVATMGERYCRLGDFDLAPVKLGIRDGAGFASRPLLSDGRGWILDKERHLTSIGARCCRRILRPPA